MGTEIAPPSAFMKFLANFANPSFILRFIRHAIPICGGLSALILAAGLGMAFFYAPTERTQGDMALILYIHVPAAWLSVFAYIIMSSAALGTLVWRHPVADAAQKSIAPVGALFTFICLITGSLWGRPTWGAYWVWDARLTSELILFLIYMSILAIWRTIDDPTRAARVAGVMTLVGLVNIPIIKFSVNWWNTQHQTQSVFRADGPSMDPSILWPLMTMAIGSSFLLFTLYFMGLRNEILRRRLHRLTHQAALADEGPRTAVFEVARS